MVRSLLVVRTVTNSSPQAQTTNNIWLSTWMRYPYFATNSFLEPEIRLLVPIVKTFFLLYLLAAEKPISTNQVLRSITIMCMRMSIETTLKSTEVTYL